MSIHNIELEKSILSTLMNHEDLLAESGVNLEPTDFYGERHKIIFSAIKALHNNNSGYDAVMVNDYLESESQLDAVGGSEYLADILMSSASKFNFKSYVERVQDLAKRRAAKDAFQLAIDSIDSKFDSHVETLVNDTIQNLNKINLGGDKEYTLAKDLTADFWTTFEAKERGEVEPFIDTGFVEFSNKLNLNKGDLCVIAGRPSMGKSTFAQNLLTYITKTTQKTGVFFSLEMPKVMVVERLVSAIGTVNLTTIKTGGKARPNNESREEYLSGISAGMHFLEELPIVIEDKAGITIGEIRSKLNVIRHKEGEIGVVVVDYIGLMGGIGKDIVNDIGEITKQLKNMAKEFDCPIIALSQLNRSLENRPDKRPKAADLRDSGKIEQDADQIVAIYRDEVYHERSADNADLAEAIILKNRNGVTGKVLLTFEGQYSRFCDFIAINHDNIPEKFMGGNHA